MSLLRNLKPVSYHYKDAIKNSNKPQYGYIAQHAEKHIPFISSYVKDIIPNIFENTTIINGNVLLHDTFNTSQYEKDDNGVIYKELILFDENNQELRTTIDRIIDDKNTLISTIIDKESIFVYGQNVDNFRNINKDAINTITTSSVQYLDKELQEMKLKMQDMETIIRELTNQIEKITNLVQLP